MFIAVGDRPYAVAVATLTGDGIPDIIVTNAGGDSVSVLLGRGNGTFLNPRRTFAVGRQPFALAVADVTGDGIPDIVTANYADNTVSVLLGNGERLVPDPDGFQHRQPTVFGRWWRTSPATACPRS